MTDVPRGLPLRHVAAVTIGNALEFYDFVTYSFFSLYIGLACFPGKNDSDKLLWSLLTFFVGFLARPVGAIVIGRWADRAGRKPAMILSFAAMGIGIVGLCCTPPYARIGMAAPILVISFRLLQGFALGGNVGPATAYMVEAAPPLRRAFYASMQAASQDTAVLIAGVISTSLASILTQQQLVDWGWRVTMLVGAAIVPFGLYLRRGLPETIHTASDYAAPEIAGGSLRPYIVLIVACPLVLASGTIATYTCDYMTTYALTTLHMTATISFGVIIVSGFFSIVGDVASGLLSDRFGRRAVMIGPGLVTLVCILPAFWMISHDRSTLVFYVAIGWLSLIFNIAGGPLIVVLAEQLPKTVRAGGISVIYAFAIAIFGGSTQYTMQKLLKWSGDPLVPAYYWTVAAAIGLAAMFFIRESAPVKLSAKR